MSVQSDKIFIQCDKIIVGYIAAVTKTEPKMVLVNMSDMADKAVQRLLGRLDNKGTTRTRYRNRKSTYTYVVYPGTDIKFRVVVNESEDYKIRYEHKEQYEKMFTDAGNVLPVWSGYDEAARLDYQNKQAIWTAWKAANPDPNADYDYTCVDVEFRYNINNRGFKLSRSEIDTILIEDILLGPSDEEQGDDDEAGQ